MLRVPSVHLGMYPAWLQLETNGAIQHQLFCCCEEKLYKKKNCGNGPLLY